MNHIKLNHQTYSRVRKSSLKRVSAIVTINASVSQLNLNSHIIATKVENPLRPEVRHTKARIKFCICQSLPIKPHIVLQDNEGIIFVNHEGRFIGFFQPAKVAGLGLSLQTINYLSLGLHSTEININALSKPHQFIHMASKKVIYANLYTNKNHFLKNYLLDRPLPLAKGLVELSEKKIPRYLSKELLNSFAQADVIITEMVNHEVRLFLTLIAKLLHITQLDIEKHSSGVSLKLITPDDKGCPFCNDTNTQALQKTQHLYDHVDDDVRKNALKNRIIDEAKHLLTSYVKNNIQHSQHVIVEANEQHIDVSYKKLQRHKYCPVCSLSGMGLDLLKYFPQIDDATQDFMQRQLTAQKSTESNSKKDDNQL